MFYSIHLTLLVSLSRLNIIIGFFTWDQQNPFTLTACGTALLNNKHGFFFTRLFSAAAQPKLDQAKRRAKILPLVVVRRLVSSETLPVVIIGAPKENCRLVP